MASGARSKFGAPMFETELFRKQMYCIAVLVTLLGLFGAPLSPFITSLIKIDQTKGASSFI